MTASETIQKMICNDCSNITSSLCNRCDIKKALDLLSKKEQGLVVEYESLEDKKEDENTWYELVGVMHFIDKFLEGDELNHTPTERADIVREKILRWLEEGDQNR